MRCVVDKTVARNFVIEGTQTSKTPLFGNTEFLDLRNAAAPTKTELTPAKAP
jgi:hypothetical protein